MRIVEEHKEHNEPRRTRGIKNFKLSDLCACFVHFV